MLHSLGLGHTRNWYYARAIGEKNEKIEVIFE